MALAMMVMTTLGVGVRGRGAAFPFVWRYLYGVDGVRGAADATVWRP